MLVILHAMLPEKPGFGLRFDEKTVARFKA
jgi:hypothetical protein